MSDEIKPALNADEWRCQTVPVPSSEAVRRVRFQAGYEGGQLLVPEKQYFVGADRHALAALALHGQPFGFTQEDVEQLRSLAEGVRMRTDPELCMSYECEEMSRYFARFAERIAALLPPAP